MDKVKIDRINELARKSKTAQLSEDELVEQKSLRDEYRAGYRKNLMAQLDNTYVIDEFGNKKKITGGNKNES